MEREPGSTLDDEFTTLYSRSSVKNAVTVVGWEIEWSWNEIG